MDGRRLADRLAFGAGRAAARIGYPCDVYRPDQPSGPLDTKRRVLQLPVALVLPSGNVNAPSPFAVPFRQAWADWSYLRVGDYLVGPEGVGFVAAIEPPKPMLVVMTNVVVTLMRFASALVVGANPYAATTASMARILLDRFPAAIFSGGIGERSHNGLPDDARLPGLVALLPAVHDVVPLVGDTAMDEFGSRLIVSGVERFSGCWRLSLWQAAA